MDFETAAFIALGQKFPEQPKTNEEMRRKLDHLDDIYRRAIQKWFHDQLVSTKA